MTSLQDLCYDTFTLMIEYLVSSIGICKAVRLRSVNSSFNSAIMHVICTIQVIDISDPSTPNLYWRMPPWLKGKGLLVKSRSHEVTKDKVLSVIANVYRALDELTHPTGESQIEQHEIIAEAVSRLQRPYSAHNAQIPDIDMKMEAQNLLSGAIVIGNLPLVESLLTKEFPVLADVNTESPYFGRPLQLAAAWGHLQIVRYLLGCGADPQARSSDSDDRDDKDWEPSMNLSLEERYVYRSSKGSALRAAVLGGHENVVHLLLEPAYRLSPLIGEYFRAIMAGARGGHLHLIQLLLQTIGRNLGDFHRLGEEILWEGTRHSQEDVVQMALDGGADINASSYPHQNHAFALSIAATQGNVHMVRFLLDRGADPNIAIHSLGYPVEDAAYCGHEKVVELLLEHGVSPVKAFISAADGGQAHLLKWLLEKYPKLPMEEIPYCGTAGQEALHRAIFVKNPKVISFLVDDGVPLNDGYVVNSNIPIFMAKTYAAQWIVDFLFSLGAKDQEYDVDNRTESYSEEDYDQQVRRGAVRITKRTWEWVGKY